MIGDAEALPQYYEINEDMQRRLLNLSRDDLVVQGRYRGTQMR